MSDKTESKDTGRKRVSKSEDTVKQLLLNPLHSLHLHHRHQDANQSLSAFLPRPWKKHKHDIIQQRLKKHRDIDDLDKKIDFSERDVRVLTVPFGCLSFHILELVNLSISISSFESSAPLYFYCVLTIGKIRRVTTVVQSPTPIKVRMDSVIMFSIELSEWRENYRNKMKIELWTFQDPDNHYIIGSALLHLYTFIHHTHGIDSHYIWGEGVLRGKMIYEYTFAYGAFGYGHSNQFRNTDCPVLETACHSLFPRIKLADEDIVESKFHTILPSRLKLMTMNSFVLERAKVSKAATTTAASQDNNTTTKPPLIVPKSVTLHQVEFQDGYPTHCKVNMAIHQTELEADFNEAYGDYLCIKKREDRLEFCQRLVDGRREDIRESEYATPLFQQLPPGEIENILNNAQTDPSSMNYPTSSHGCTTNHKSVVFEEDEKLFEKFPSTDRSSGYIGRVFGFSKHDPSDERPDFPLEALQGKIKQHRSQISLSLWIRYLWSRFGACLSWMRQTIMPNLKDRQRMPEISVTLPSPSVSTTNLCVLWVDEDPPFKGPLNEEQILRQEASRFGLPADDEPPEGKQAAFKDDSDDDDDDEQQQQENGKKQQKLVKPQPKKFDTKGVTAVEKKIK